MMRSSSGRLMTLAPMVPLPEIRPSSQLFAAWELMKPRSGTGRGPGDAEIAMGVIMMVRVVIAARV